MSYAIQQLTRNQYEEKVTQTAPLVAAHYAGRDVRPLPDNYSDFEQLYYRVGWLYRGIQRIAQTAASVPLKTVRRIRRGDTVEEKDASGSDLARLLAHVNNHWTGPDHIEASVIDLNTTGNFYWEMERGVRSRKPMELWRLRPSRVRIKPDPKRLIGGYVYSTSRDKRLNLEPEDVVHGKFLHTGDDHYGLGPVKVAMNAAVIDLQGMQYNRTVIENHGMPSVVLHTDLDNIRPEEQADIKQQWREKYAGPENAGRLLVLNKGRKLEPIGFSPDELQWIQTRKMTREEMGAIIGVPPIMMGLYEGVNFATADQQEKMFWSATVKPTLEKICAQATEFLAPQFPVPGLAVVPDFSGVECLQEDKHKESERVLKLVDQRVITPNEARAMLNIEGEVPGGDEILVGVNQVPLDEVGMLPGPSEEGEGKLFPAAADHGGDGDGQWR